MGGGQVTLSVVVSISISVSISVSVSVSISVSISVPLFAVVVAGGLRVFASARLAVGDIVHHGQPGDI